MKTETGEICQGDEEEDKKEEGEGEEEVNEEWEEKTDEYRTVKIRES